MSEPHSPESDPDSDALSRDCTAFAVSVGPSAENALLDTEEFARLVYLLALLNDATVTQLDTDESDDLSRLLYKISNDGDESGRER